MYCINFFQSLKSCLFEHIHRCVVVRLEPNLGERLVGGGEDSEGALAHQGLSQPHLVRHLLQREEPA